MWEWLIQRFCCLLRGHRDLTQTPSYTAILPDGRVRELYVCLACGSLVWKLRRPMAMEALTWKNLQL
jgi:hypothetical protein